VLGDTIVGNERGPVRDVERFAASLARGAALDVLRAGRSLRIVLPPVPGEDTRAA
jgi:hypothetical protein